MQGIFFVVMGHSIGESHQIVTEMDIFHYKAVVKKTEIKVAEIPYSLYAGFYNLRGYILRRLPVSAYNYNINGIFFTKIFYPAYGLYLKANKMIAHQGVIIVKKPDKVNALGLFWDKIRNRYAHIASAYQNRTKIAFGEDQLAYFLL